MSEIGKLRQVGTELWLAEGPAVNFLGIPYPTRMAVLRLEGGELWVWSPIALNEGLVAQIDELGPVREVVEPNKIHHLALEEWTKRYPAARLHAPPGLARKRKDILFDTELGDRPDVAWEGQVEQVVFRGSVFMDEVVFFHRASRTVLVCDLVQRFDPETLSGWRAWLMRADGLVGPGGSTPREWRASWWNRELGREALRVVLSWEFERLVIAHGVLPARDARVELQSGLDWLR